MLKHCQKFVLASALLAIGGAQAQTKTATATMDTPACTSWAGWHEWVEASLTKNGAAPNSNCPSYIDKGARVEVIEADDGEGAATVKWRGKTWFTHADRLK